MKILQLTKGKYTFVDDEDYEWILKMGRWCYVNSGYAFKLAKQNDKQRIGSSLLLHRVIMDKYGLLEIKKEVDHINRNKLDNQKKNLRIETSSENKINKYVTLKNNTYRGVTWKEKTKKWRVRIKKNNKEIFIGSFDNEIEGAIAYDKMAKKLFKDFAILNFTK